MNKAVLLKSIISIMILTLLLSCYPKPLKPREEQMNSVNIIHSALERLVLKTDGGAFLIIEENGTHKYVQFSMDSTNNLIFDLPDQALTSEELARALLVLEEYKITHDEWEVFDRPGGKVVGTQKGFNKNLGKDIDNAAEITYAVFTKIYLFVEPIKLSITEK